MALRPRNILSLCAGVGGLELGILLGLHCRGEAGRGVCYVEREGAAAASLVASMEAGWLHPAPVWSNMLTFDARPWRGLVSILASGDPCQDNSVAGKRAGSEGSRFLAPEVVRIADECRPDLIFRENVPGNAGEQLHALVPALERLGYRVAAGIFSSAETGNTMRRERLFIMTEREAVGHERSGGGWGRRDGPPHRCDELEIASGTRPGDHGGQVGRCGGQSVEAGTEGLRPRDGPALPDGADAGCGDMAHPALQLPGEARPDHGRSEERHRGTSGELAGAGRDEQDALAGNPGQVCRLQDAECGPENGAALSGGSRGAMGRTSGAEPQGQQPGQHRSAGRQVKGRSAALSGRAILPPAVIPGPTDSRWIDVLDRWPELQPALSQEEAESHLRRGIDAMAHRVERLRATGNGVDPVVAAYAFLRLDALLAQARATGESVLMENAA